jgi:hypothetical protein
MENNRVEAGCSIGAPGEPRFQINEITIDAQDNSEIDSDIQQVSYGQNNCDPGATCSLQLDNTVEITAAGASKVNADIDVKLNGQNNCDPTATCSLKLGRTIIIEANEGEVVNVDYQDNVEYVQECDAGNTCEYKDVKTIKCTVNGCEEVIPVVLDSQDALEADRELIVTQNTLQTEECSSGSAECPSSSAITVPTDKVERTEAGAVIPIDTTTSSGTIPSPSLISTTSSTPTVITDPSQSTVEPPLETAGEVTQERQPETLKESSEAADAVTTDATENNSEFDSADKISSTADVETTDSNNIENVEENDDKSTDSPDTNIDDSGTTSSPDDADDNENTESSGEENDTTDDSDRAESTESDDSSSENDNNSESDNDSGSSDDNSS